MLSICNSGRGLAQPAPRCVIHEGNKAEGDLSRVKDRDSQSPVPSTKQPWKVPRLYQAVSLTVIGDLFSPGIPSHWILYVYQIDLFPPVEDPYILPYPDFLIEYVLCPSRNFWDNNR